MIVQHPTVANCNYIFTVTGEVYVNTLIPNTGGLCTVKLDNTKLNDWEQEMFNSIVPANYAQLQSICMSSAMPSETELILQDSYDDSITPDDSAWYDEPEHKLCNPDYYSEEDEEYAKQYSQEQEEIRLHLEFENNKEFYRVCEHCNAMYDSREPEHICPLD